MPRKSYIEDYGQRVGLEGMQALMPPGWELTRPTGYGDKEYWRAQAGDKVISSKYAQNMLIRVLLYDEGMDDGEYQG